MNEPPIPPQSNEPGQEAQYWRGQQCMNCGQMNAPGAPFCARCGKSLKRRSTAADVLLVLLFIVVGVPSLCLGGCLVILSGSIALGYSGRTGVGSTFGALALGLLGVAIFGGLLHLAFFRKKE